MDKQRQNSVKSKNRLLQKIHCVLVSHEQNFNLNSFSKCQMSLYLEMNNSSFDLELLVLKLSVFTPQKIFVKM